MFQAVEIIPAQEIDARIARCQKFLQTLCPMSAGMLLSNRINMYYCTGTLANGYLWIPQQGSPTLFVKKALERAHLESPYTDTLPFRSFSTFTDFLREQGELPRSLAIEYASLTYDMVERLRDKLPDVQLVNADMVLSRARSCKSAWELKKMRHTGEIHKKGMTEHLPSILCSGMTEHAIGLSLYKFFLDNGCGGPTRLANFGQELFIGNIAIGMHSDYPNYFNGPQGNIGMHPATPYGGSQAIWKKGELLTIDVGCTCDGYNTDKTTVYYSGSPESIPENVQRAHQCCLDIELQTARALKSGAIPSQLYQTALDMAASAGFSEGFMGFDQNQVPFLGHGIGLTVDEWPVLAKRFDIPLEEGTVMAIEPKITLPDYGMVGTENTYLVTKSGGESLTGPPDQIVCITR